MVKRKSSPKKKTRRKTRKTKLFKNSLVKAFAGLAILVVFVVAAGLVAHFLTAPGKPLRTVAPPESTPAVKQPIAKIPTFEIYPSKEIPPVKKPLKPPAYKKEQLPRVAIIIDDLGYDRKIAEKLSKLDAVLTFSILPHSPYQKDIARLSQAKGFDTILHLPMEPIEYPSVDPGPGTLLTSMTPDQLLRELEIDLDAVPFIRGVNNHMGSRMTAESSQMYQIFSILKKRGLFFIDSRTTRDTLCRPSARLFQIPFAQRDIFLDHKQDKEFIRRQIKKLVQIAKRNGQAVGIGHPHSITYKVLREMLPYLQKEVQLVPTSDIVHPLG
jgi:polysaccharide deacetylase 2 family uncharacterized protein YibQ